MSNSDVFTSEARAGTLARLPDGCDLFCSGDFCVDCSEIELHDELAKGSYGTVYAATLHGETYAVKIEEFSDGIEEQVNLLVELTMLQSFPHDKMVRFHGAGWLPKTHVGAKIMILMELCKNGALREVLKLNVPWALRVRMALDVAQGLAFLHDQNIIHRDVKTTNVLIDDVWRAKLCDFSFACHEDSTSKREFVYGTDEFMAPEIALAQDFTKSADIFSFGIVLCEMATAREPSDKFLHRRAQDVFAVNEKEFRGAVQKGCPEAFEALALQCCDVEPGNRPTAQMCVDELEVMLNDLGGPDNIDFTPAQPPKQQVLANAFALVTGVREGHVQRPKTLTPMARSASTASPNAGAPGGVGMHARGGSWEQTPSKAPSDADARLALLEVQVQELKAENRRINRELHAMMVLYAERDRIIRDGSSLTGSQRDGGGSSVRVASSGRRAWGSGSGSSTRPMLPTVKGSGGRSSTVGSSGTTASTATTSVGELIDSARASALHPHPHPHPRRSVLDAFAARGAHAADDLSAGPADEDEATRIKAAILEAAEQIVLEAAHHMHAHHVAPAAAASPAAADAAAAAAAAGKGEGADPGASLRLTDPAHLGASPGAGAGAGLDAEEEEAMEAPSDVFLAREVSRLQAQLDSLRVQISLRGGADAADLAAAAAAAAGHDDAFDLGVGGVGRVAAVDLGRDLLQSDNDSLDDPREAAAATRHPRPNKSVTLNDDVHVSTYYPPSSPLSPVDPNAPRGGGGPAWVPARRPLQLPPPPAGRAGQRGGHAGQRRRALRRLRPQRGAGQVVKNFSISALRAAKSPGGGGTPRSPPAPADDPAAPAPAPALGGGVVRRESGASFEALSDSDMGSVSVSEADNTVLTASIASAWGLRAGSPGTTLTAGPGAGAAAAAGGRTGGGAASPFAPASLSRLGPRTPSFPAAGAGAVGSLSVAAAPAGATATAAEAAAAPVGTVTPAVSVGGATRSGSYADVAKAALSPLTPLTPAAPPAPPKGTLTSDAQRSTISYT